MLIRIPDVTDADEREPLLVVRVGINDNFYGNNIKIDRDGLLYSLGFLSLRERIQITSVSRAFKYSIYASRVHESSVLLSKELRVVVDDKNSQLKSKTIREFLTSLSPAIKRIQWDSVRENLLAIEGAAVFLLAMVVLPSSSSSICY